jgi:hypothetical protein
MDFLESIRLRTAVLDISAKKLYGCIASYSNGRGLHAVRQKHLHHLSKDKQDFYCSYRVILHSHLENLAAFCGKSHSFQKQPWSDSYIQIYKWTQCSNIHAKGIRLLLFMWLSSLTSLTVLMLEVYKMDIVHIMLIWIIHLPCNFKKFQIFLNVNIIQPIHVETILEFKQIFNHNICKNTSLYKSLL